MPYLHSRIRFRSHLQAEIAWGLGLVSLAAIPVNAAMKRMELSERDCK